MVDKTDTGSGIWCVGSCWRGGIHRCEVFDCRAMAVIWRRALIQAGECRKVVVWEM